MVKELFLIKDPKYEQNALMIAASLTILQTADTKDIKEDF